MWRNLWKETELQLLGVEFQSNVSSSFLFFFNFLWLWNHCHSLQRLFISIYTNCCLIYDSWFICCLQIANHCEVASSPMRWDARAESVNRNSKENKELVKMKGILMDVFSTGFTDTLQWCYENSTRVVLHIIYMIISLCASRSISAHLLHIFSP